MTLDCYDYDSTYDSIKVFLSVRDSVLNQILEEYNNAIVTNTHFPEIEVITKKYNITLPEENIICFFHFTRTLKPDSFMDGLHPLHIIKKKILIDMHILVLEKYDLTEWERIIDDFLKLRRIGCLTSLDRMDDDDGPNGFLIREFGLTKYRDVYYLDNSEFIEDSLFILENKVPDIRKKYYNASKKCVIKFQIKNLPSNRVKSYIKAAFEYLAYKRASMIIDYCNAAYWNEGKTVDAKDIITVEIIE